MSRSFGERILSLLLENQITSAELTTQLTNTLGWRSGLSYMLYDQDTAEIAINNATSFGLLANSIGAVSTLAESYNATKELVKNSNALYTLVTTANIFDAYKNNSNNWSMLNDFVNKWYSKLKKETFLADGTFYTSTLNIKAMSIVAVGMGGEGNVSGGSGAESGVNVITSSLPTDDLTISVGNARLTLNPGVGTIAEGSSVSSPSLGTLLSVAGGAELLASAPLGGGSNTGGNFSNGNIISSPWQYEDCTRKGGNGGFNGTAGTAGIYGIGGAAETISAGAGCGTGFGSGGGGTVAGAPAVIGGTLASVNSGCGSGAGSGIGGSGIVIIHYIVN